MGGESDILADLGSGESIVIVMCSRVDLYHLCMTSLDS